MYHNLHTQCEANPNLATQVMFVDVRTYFRNKHKLYIIKGALPKNPDKFILVNKANTISLMEQSMLQRASTIEHSYIHSLHELKVHNVPLSKQIELTSRLLAVKVAVPSDAWVLKSRMSDLMKQKHISYRSFNTIQHIRHNADYVKNIFLNINIAFSNVKKNHSLLKKHLKHKLDYMTGLTQHSHADLTNLTLH